MRIEEEAACHTALTAAAMTVGSPFVETEPRFPKGCYGTSRNTAFFNKHAVGAGYLGAQLLCAVVTGAPFAPPPMSARASARVFAARRCVQKRCKWPNRR